MCVYTPRSFLLSALLLFWAGCVLLQRFWTILMFENLQAGGQERRVHHTENLLCL